jgi:hypothetical protein
MAPIRLQGFLVEEKEPTSPPAMGEVVRRIGQRGGFLVR